MLSHYPLGVTWILVTARALGKDRLTTLPKPSIQGIGQLISLNTDWRVSALCQMHEANSVCLSIRMITIFRTYAEELEPSSKRNTNGTTFVENAEDLTKLSCWRPQPMLGFLALLSYIENPLALAVACHRFVCWHSQGDMDDVTCNRLRHFEEYSYACSGWRKDKSQDGCLCCGSGFCCGLLCSGGSSSVGFTC